MFRIVRTRTLNQLALQAEEAATNLEVSTLTIQTLNDSYETLFIHAEAAIDFVEKLWNLMSVGKGNAIMEAILDDALPLLKEHSFKYKDVNVEEATTNVRASIQASQS